MDRVELTLKKPSLEFDFERVFAILRSLHSEAGGGTNIADESPRNVFSVNQVCSRFAIDRQDLVTSF